MTDQFYKEIPWEIDHASKFLTQKNEHYEQIMEIYDIWSKIDGIHSWQEKSIGSLLVKLLMICDFVTEWWLLWGSGRAARHDNIIWTATVSLYRTLFPYLLNALLYQMHENSRRPEANTHFRDASTHFPIFSMCGSTIYRYIPACVSLQVCWCWGYAQELFDKFSLFSKMW